jgi:hypothetical protein
LEWCYRCRNWITQVIVFSWCSQSLCWWHKENYAIGRLNVLSIWHVQKRTYFSQNEVTTLEETSFFFKKNQNVTSKIFLVMMHLFLPIDQQMQIFSRRPQMGRIFIILQLSWYQFNNKISGRLDIFLSHRSYHPPMFLFMVMDKCVISFYLELKIISNMKLQLTIHYIHLHKFCVNVNRFIGWSWKVGAL